MQIDLIKSIWVRWAFMGAAMAVLFRPLESNPWLSFIIRE